MKLAKWAAVLGIASFFGILAGYLWDVQGMGGFLTALFWAVAVLAVTAIIIHKSEV